MGLQSGEMFAQEDDKLRRFHELERENIARNQWYLGEKWGRPVTWEEASWHFCWNYRREWLNALRVSGEYPFD